MIEYKMSSERIKLYTKKGDNGETSIFGGKQVQKFDPILNLLGTIDELSAHIGHLFAVTEQMNLKIIQKKLLDIGSFFAGYKIIPISNEDVYDIEQLIDFYDNQNPPLTEFILVGSSVPDAIAHICRAVCRRVEREINFFDSGKFNNNPRANTQSNWKYFRNKNPQLFVYVNRLSDFFFAYGRFLCHQNKKNEIKRNDIV